MTATMPTRPPTSPPSAQQPEPPRSSRVAAFFARWNWRYVLYASIILAVPVGYVTVKAADRLLSPPPTPQVTVNQSSTATSQPTATSAPAGDNYFDYLAIGQPDGVFTYGLTTNAMAMIPLDPEFLNSRPPRWDRTVSRDIAAQVRRMTGDQCQFGIYISTTETLIQPRGGVENGERVDRDIARRIITPTFSADAPRLLQCAAQTGGQIPTTPTTAGG